MIKNIIITITIFLFLASPAYSFDSNFDKTDKQLFMGLVAAQIFDGATTVGHLGRNPNNYIKDKWNWKYGSDRSSDERVWATKAVELGLAYFVANELPNKPRKIFLISTMALLLYCGASNGVQFSITY